MILANNDIFEYRSDKKSRHASQPEMARIGKLILLTAFLILLAAYCISNQSVYGSDYLFVVFWLLFLMGNILLAAPKSHTSYSTAAQMFLICVLWLAFWCLTLFASLASETDVHKKCALSGLVSLMLSTVVWLWRLRRREYGSLWLTAKVLSRKYGICTVAILLFVLLCIPTLTLLFKSDSYTYFSMLIDGAGKWNFSLCDMWPFRIGYHASYGYTFFALLGYYVAPWQGLGIRIAHIILAVTAYCSIAATLKKLYAGRTNSFYFAVAACFLFNPLVLGLIQEMNLDFPMACFLALFVWAHCGEKKVLSVFFAALMCFSKEYGVVLVFFYATGVLVGRLIFGILNSSSDSIVKPWELCIGIPALFFIVDMLLQPSWGGSSAGAQSGLGAVNTFQINIDYIIFRIKELTILNFQWMAMLVILCGLAISALRHRLATITPSLVGVFFSMMAYGALTILYFTYPHYRYLAPSAVYLPILLGAACSSLSNVVQLVIPLSIALLFGVQSFVSIDPISNQVFRRVDAGNGDIISLARYSDDPYRQGILIDEEHGGDLSSEVFRDYVQNNREYTLFQQCFEDLLMAIDYGDAVGIVVYPIYPLGNQENAQYTFTNCFGVNDPNLIRISDDGGLVNWPFGNQINWISTTRATEACRQMESVWVVRMPTQQALPAFDEYLAAFEVKEMVEQQCGPWSIQAYRIDEKNWSE